MKLNCEFFYGKEADNFRFYRIPQVLVTDERFKDLSYGAKILYGLFLDRMGLSILNKWYCRYCNDSTWIASTPEEFEEIDNDLKEMGY